MTVSETLKVAVKNPRTALSVGLGKTTRLPGNLASALLFGNPIGVRNNVGGWWNEERCRRATDGVDGARADGRELRRTGLLPLGEPYDEGLVSDIQEEYGRLIEDDERSYVRGEYDGETFSRGILLAHEAIPKLGDLLTDDIKRQIRGYYGSHFRVKHLITWRNYSVPEETARAAPGSIYSEDWHCDRRSTDVLKLFVNLSDVTEDDGPFHILSRDETGRLARRWAGERFDYVRADASVDADEMTKATGPAGTALLCNTELCYHRAGIPAPGHQRDIVQFQFKPASEPLPDDWLEDVEVKPFEQRILDGEI